MPVGLSRNEKAIPWLDRDPAAVVDAVLRDPELASEVNRHVRTAMDAENAAAMQFHGLLEMFKRDCMDEDGSVKSWARENPYLAKAICIALTHIDICRRKKGGEVVSVFTVAVESAGLFDREKRAG